MSDPIVLFEMSSISEITMLSLDLLGNGECDGDFEDEQDFEDDMIDFN